MGRQIHLYFNPDDVHHFEKAAKEQLGATVLAHRHSRDIAAPADSIVTRNAGGLRSFGYLVRPQDLEKLVLRHVSAQGHWVVDGTRSPLVELDGALPTGRF